MKQITKVLALTEMYLEALKALEQNPKRSIFESSAESARVERLRIELTKEMIKPFS